MVLEVQPGVNYSWPFQFALCKCFNGVFESQPIFASKKRQFTCAGVQGLRGEGVGRGVYAVAALLK